MALVHRQITSMTVVSGPASTPRTENSQSTVMRTIVILDLINKPFGVKYTWEPDLKKQINLYDKEKTYVKSKFEA